MHGYSNSKKIIALLPFRNEDWIISEYIKSIKNITDHIIAYDDRSTDNTRKILEDAGAQIITKNYESESYFAEYQVRQELLEEGRRQGGTHFVCLDADEIFTKSFYMIAKETILNLKPGHSIWMDWINLYKSQDMERIDGDYKKLNKAFIFCDDINLKFKYAFVGVSRTPTETLNSLILNRNQGAVIHFQFLNISRALTKRIWYMCSEIIKSDRSDIRVNATYAIQKRTNVPTRKIDTGIFVNLSPEQCNDYNYSSDWRFLEIIKWFKIYGVEKFEGLDIWDNKQLKDYFIKETNRIPKPKLIPEWILLLNHIKNKILNALRAYREKNTIESMFNKIHSLIPLFLRKKIGPIFAFTSYIIRVYFKKKIFNILSLNETIEYIKKNNASVIRFGDGEMSLINNNKLGFQLNNNSLRDQLIKILGTSNKKLLLCIPNIFEKLDNFTPRSFWFTIHHVFKYNKSWRKLTSQKQTYGDAFITRPFLSYKNKIHAENIFNNLFSIWQNKSVVLIEGSLSRLGVGNNMFKDVSDIKRILCPAENAFSKYDEIKKEVLKIPKDVLILISLGPTAKVLAYDLFMLGYRVIDIGHIDMEYEMFLRKAEKLIKVKYKYFNELEERSPEKCVDRKYLSEIIAEIN